MVDRFRVTDDQVTQFQQDGYLLVGRLFDTEEMELLLKIGKADQEKNGQIHAVADTEGGTSKLWLTADTAREDIYNGFCHSRRIVETMERLMGGEVYHYKMVSAAGESHQPTLGLSQGFRAH